jgi:hypothetical protein
LPFFTLKRGIRRCLAWIDGFRSQLAEAARAHAQTAVTAQQAALATENRASGDSGQLVAAVGFMKRTMGQAKPAEAIETLVEFAFAGNTADDKMGMR